MTFSQCFEGREATFVVVIECIRLMAPLEHDFVDFWGIIWNLLVGVMMTLKSKDRPHPPTSFTISLKGPKWGNGCKS